MREQKGFAFSAWAASISPASIVLLYDILIITIPSYCNQRSRYTENESEAVGWYPCDSLVFPFTLSFRNSWTYKMVKLAYQRFNCGTNWKMTTYKLDSDLYDVEYTLNLWHTWCHFPYNQNTWIWELRDRSRFVILLTIVPNDLLAKFLLPIITTLGPAGLEVLVSKGRTLPPRETHKNEPDVETAIFISSCHWTNRQKVKNPTSWSVERNGLFKT